MKNIRKQINIVLALYFIVALSVCGIETLSAYGCYDTDFLINRAENMLQCIKDLRYPFFYYNDFGGAGYGSSFFYGQLTLLPFLPLLYLGDKVFLYVYLGTSLLLTYFGVRSFCKRFSDDYDIISLMYLGSTWLLYFLCETTLFPNVMGVAIGFFFLAFCVDFFRDNKSFIPATLSFVLLLNTHLITSIICFIGCIYFMISYIDFKRVTSYAKFAVMTLISCLYNILNILLHMETTKDFDNIAFQASSGFSMDNIPIRGVIFNTFISIKRTGLVYMNVLLFMFIIIGILKFRYTLKEYISLAIISVSMVIGCQSIWSWLIETFPVFIQFPYRYVPFVLVGLLLITFRKYKSKFAFICILGLSVIEVTAGLYWGICFNHDLKFGETKDHFNEVGLGEYFDSSFDKTFKTYDFLKEKGVYDYDSDIEYSSFSDKDKLYIDLRGNNSKEVTIFKLWYRGYKAYTVSSDEKHEIIDEVPISKGRSQFIEINTENIDDFVMIRYEQPLYMVLILCFDYILFILLFVFYRLRY